MNARRATTLAALLGAALAAAGCASTQPYAPTPLVQASCPPLSPEPARTDPDALKLRNAELRAWYQQCREAALYQPATPDIWAPLPRGSAVLPKGTP